MQVCTDTLTHTRIHERKTKSDTRACARAHRHTVSHTQSHAEREREKERQIDRQSDREKQRERDKRERTSEGQTDSGLVKVWKKCQLASSPSIYFSSSFFDTVFKDWRICTPLVPRELRGIHSFTAVQTTVSFASDPLCMPGSRPYVRWQHEVDWGEGRGVLGCFTVHSMRLLV